MSDSTHKSYLRDSHGPRAVDPGCHEKSRGDSRRQDDSSKQRSSKHSASSPRTTKPESSSHRWKTSALSTAYASSATLSERPVWEMDFLQQPPRNIALGATVEASVMISLRFPSPEMVDTYRNLDTTRYMGFVSLVTETRSGEIIAVENGSLTGQKGCDSIHTFPANYADTLARNEPCRLHLGYFSFPELLIRQQGLYRLQVTLMKMGTSGADHMLSENSEAIKVERRTTAPSSNPRKHQRA